MTVPANDPSIADDDTLLRRVPNFSSYTAPDGTGGRRVSSAALELRDDETGCSVEVQERLADPQHPVMLLDGCPPDWGLACCAASDARYQDLHRVVGDPLVDDPAHAHIVPTVIGRKAQKRNFSDLAKRMRWVREPTMSAE